MNATIKGKSRTLTSVAEEAAEAELTGTFDNKGTRMVL
jgi:hypothetical protein